MKGRPRIGASLSRRSSGSRGSTVNITIACSTEVGFGIHLPSTVGLGGIETACVELSSALAARGHTITLLSRTEQNGCAGGVTNLGYQ